MATTARTIVLQYLTGSFPARLDELVARARAEGADEQTIALVAALEDRTYDSAMDVREALEHP
ncbi:DUF2795 domain-containing protein [Pseudonocardia sp. CA-107938]|uniref:DUF2795 domain-containing protein n=1 Tax=Pseudonocardia sp. CA-107938 TaxID=3240021 RepID=UPI003D922E80